MEAKKAHSEDRLRFLYPEVDECETPLPRAWNQADKFTYILLSQNNLRVHYKGSGKNQRDAASVRATHPIPAACGVYYFEVKIVSKGRDGLSKRSRYMGVGLSAQGVSTNRLPGWDKQSFGYHGDDGHSFCSSGTGQPYGPTFTTGDVIGCGVNLVDNSCFYTKNGHNLGVAFTNLPPNLFPTVGLQTPGEVVDANFGQQPFMFDFESMIKDLRKKTTAKIEAFPVQDSQGEFQAIIHRLTLSYLVHHGYSETAQAFAKVTQQSIAEPIDSVNNRQRIQRLILTGRIREAIEFTQELYPTLLERNKELMFELRCRQFVEMFVDVVKMRKEMARDQGLEKMDVDGQSSSGQINNNANNTKTVSLQKMLEFGKDLCDMEKELVDPSPRVKKMYREACALVAYPNPTLSPMAHLLSPSQRESVSASLNTAILALRGDPSKPPLETCLAHTKSLVHLMSRNGLGVCAFANIESVLN